MRLRPISVAIAFLLMLALAYTAWWSSAAWAVRKGIEGWADARRAEGAEVTIDGLRVEGYPLALTVVAHRLHLTLPNGIRVSTDGITATADAWDPLRIHETQWGRLNIEGPGGTRLLAARQASGYLDLSAQGAPQELELALDDVTAGPAGAEATAQRVTLRFNAAQEPATTRTQPAFTVTLAADAITLPPTPPTATPWLPQGPFSRFAVTLTPMGPALVDATAPALTAWMEMGGTVEATDLALDWGEISLRGDATLALDTTLQPQMAGTIDIGGLPAYLGRLAAAGLIERSFVDRLGPLLALADQPRDDGIRRARLPVTVQDGRVMVGTVVMGTLPRVDWPQ